MKEGVSEGVWDMSVSQCVNVVVMRYMEHIYERGYEVVGGKIWVMVVGACL